MPSENANIYLPDPKLAKAAYVSSLQQYAEMYKQSLENPAEFWGNIAKQFYWETPADPEKFFSYNFDISKGPIFIKWMEGASTNITYNLLDRNVKNGLGDKIAFHWYVWPWPTLLEFFLYVIRAHLLRLKSTKAALLETWDNN